MLRNTTPKLSVTHHTSSIINDSLTTKQLVEAIKSRIKTETNLQISIDETLDLVDQLAEFDLGRFLLHNRSMDGYWTAYIFRNEKKKNLHPLEDWLLNRSLLTCARERFYRFQSLIQAHLQPIMALASIPCGLMDDLLTLNYKDFRNIKLTGIDLDKESLKLAKENAVAHDLLNQLTLLQKDAWFLNIMEEYDLITSNGLNMYEPDSGKVLQLYSNFYNALRPNGLLLISFLPPPPDGKNSNYTWSNFGIDPEDLKREFTIFGIILQAKFLNFCTEEEVCQQLESLGFRIEDINYNSKGILPIAVARK